MWMERGGERREEHVFMGCSQQERRYKHIKLYIRYTYLVNSIICAEPLFSPSNT